MSSPKEKIVFDVPPELKAIWLQLCKENGVTQAEMFRRMIEEARPK